MPTTININGPYKAPRYAPVATEKELLDFANKVRQAGGADPIPHLLPAEKGQPNTCLIAKALNFQSSISGLALFGESAKLISKPESGLWAMTVNDNALALRLASELELPLVVKYSQCYLVLPEHIGNAAHAFDNGQAFQNYVQSPWSNRW